jgi:hypothetical protein
VKGDPTDTILDRFRGPDGRLDLDKIAELAKAASSGPWLFAKRADRPYVEVVGQVVDGVRYGGAVWQPMEDPSEAVLDLDEGSRTGPYLEACSPEIMLALIAELRTARDRPQLTASELRLIESHDGWLEHCPNCHDRVQHTTAHWHDGLGCWSCARSP